MNEKEEEWMRTIMTREEWNETDEEGLKKEEDSENDYEEKDRKEGLRGMIVKLNKDLGLMCLP